MSKEQQERQYQVIFNVWFMNFYFEGSDNCNKKQNRVQISIFPNYLLTPVRVLRALPYSLTTVWAQGKLSCSLSLTLGALTDVCAHTSTAPPLYYLCGVRGSSKY